MRIRLRTAFLTLVLLAFYLVTGLAIANPHYDAPFKKNLEENVEKSVSPETQENISVSPVSVPTMPAKKKLTDLEKASYYYAYRKEFEVHLGAVFGFEDSSDDKDLINLLAGFSFVLPKMLSPKYVVGADLSTVGHGHAYVVRRHIHNEKSSFRPYYDYGIMQKFVPEEKFASLSNMDNYLLRLGVGLGDIASPPRSVKVDLNLAIGKEDFLLLFTYGYSWGF